MEVEQADRNVCMGNAFFLDGQNRQSPIANR